MADEDRDPVMTAYFAGHDASDAQVEEWKTRVDANPKDMVARAGWIAWAMAHRQHGQPPEAALHEELIWLVRHHPGSELAGMTASHCGMPRDWVEVEPLRAAWLHAVREHPDDAEVLGHAAQYFLFQDPDQTLALLERARDLQPKNALRELVLSQHWSFRARFVRVPDPHAGARALAHAERAVELEGEEAIGDSMRVNRLQCTVTADRWDLAERYAKEMLEWIERQPAWVRSGDSAYHTHRILGHVALRRGDVAAARSHLLRCCSGGSSPVLGSFGPDFSLAQELLDRGERETVLEFLEQCRTIWTHHTSTVDRLVQEIRSGASCRLSRN
jgi:hypothetical protein